MLGADDTNPIRPVTMDGGRFPYNANVVRPQMQSNVHFGCNAHTVNMAGDKNTYLVNPPERIRSDTHYFSHHQFPVLSYDNTYQNEVGQARNMQKPIPVSTGLKLSYGEEEHNSSLSSAGESPMVNLSSVYDNLRPMYMWQSAEFDQYIRVQEENIRKGIAELKHRQTLSLLNAFEKEVRHGIHEKDVKIENLNQQNKELMEKVRHLSVEVHSCHLRAKYYESVVNSLRNELNQVTQHGVVLVKEGCDESTADDAISSCNQNVLNPSANHQNHPPSLKELVQCKACKSKEVSVLMLPCRHLCLCIDCEAVSELCPVCGVKKTQSIHVNVS